MTIQILGGGCANCRALEENARTAAKNLGIDAGIEKVTDSDAILEMGVLRTPGYAINRELQDSGRVAPVEEIEAALKRAQGEA
jgi:small redox-active disulfide protein 2